MWLPFFTFEAWSKLSDETTINSSLQDTSFRLFELQFELFNPITYENNIGIVESEESRFLRISNIYKSKSAELSFEPDGDRKLVNKLYIRVTADNASDCFVEVVNFISQVLSWWSYQTTASTAIKRVRIKDVEHGAEWETQQISINAHYQAILPPEFGADEEVYSMLSLYREGRNSSSVFYRFLCFYKILESLKKQSGLFGLARKICENNSIPVVPRPTLKITKELLETNKLNPEVLEYFIDKKVGFFTDETENLRNKVVHAIVDENSSVYNFYNFDEMSAYLEISSVVNLADLLAHEVLIIEFDYLERIRKLVNPVP